MDAVTDLNADLGPDAASLSGVTGVTRKGRKVSVDAADIAVSDIDFANEGSKTYQVYLAGQRTPATLTLLTRTLNNYFGSISLDPTDSLPDKVEVTYSDGGKGMAEAEWSEYEWNVGEQTVTGKIIDAAGRTAQATLTVTGRGFEWERAVELFAEIDGQEVISVNSSFEAFKKAIQSEYDALKACTAETPAETVVPAYIALRDKVEENKSLLIANAPIKEALALYGREEKKEQSAQDVLPAFTAAYEALTAALDECADIEERDALIEDCKETYEALYLDFDYLGFGFAEENGNGLATIAIPRQAYHSVGTAQAPLTYWTGSTVSYELEGDFTFSFEVNTPMDYSVNTDAGLDISIMTQNRFINYRQYKNLYDADCLTRGFNVDSWGDATNVAVKGVLPNPENKASAWQADVVDLLQPHKVTIWREGNLYYYMMEQNNQIIHLYYDRIDDTSNVRVAVAAFNCGITLENVTIKGIANPFVIADNVEWGFADGSAVAADNGVYTAESGRSIYSDASVDAKDRIYSFSASLSDFEEGKTASMTIGLGQKSGFVMDTFVVSFNHDKDGKAIGRLQRPYLGISVAMPGQIAAQHVEEEMFEALEADKTYTFAILVSNRDTDSVIRIYVLDGNKVVFESAEYIIGLQYEIFPILTANNAMLRVSALAVKNVAGVVIEEIDEKLYSSESVDAYESAIAKIDLSIVTLMNASEEQLAQLISEIEAAKALLQYTKIQKITDEFVLIRVKFGAEKVVLPLRVRVLYDNGQSKNELVTWDEVNTSVAGVQQVRGVVLQPDGTEFEVFYPIEVEAAPDTGKTADNGCKGCKGSVSMEIGVICAISVAIGGMILIRRKKD